MKRPLTCNLPTNNIGGMTGNRRRGGKTESIKWFIEDKAILQSYNSARRLPPPPFPLPWASCLSFSVFLCACCRAYWLERGERGGRGAKSYDREKAWPSWIIQYSGGFDGFELLNIQERLNKQGLNYSVEHIDQPLLTKLPNVLTLWTISTDCLFVHRLRRQSHCSKRWDSVISALSSSLSALEEGRGQCGY